MATYRNISGEPLWAHDHTGRIVKVEPDEVIDAADNFYWQTGETGEDPLWELVSAPAPAAGALPPGSSEPAAAAVTTKRTRGGK